MPNEAIELVTDFVSATRAMPSSTRANELILKIASKVGNSRSENFRKALSRAIDEIRALKRKDWDPTELSFLLFREGQISGMATVVLANQRKKVARSRNEATADRNGIHYSERH